MDLDNNDSMSRQSTATPGAAGGGGGGGEEQQPVKASSRKSHRKTRTGCRTCKQRKIKCDETRPECKNCQKHSVRCDFIPPRPTPPGNGLSNHGSPSTVDTPNQISGNHLPSFERFASDALNGLQPPPLNLQDLELLHNFSTHTASTLHSNPIIKTLIRTSVPQLGLEYEFVMRGVLAVSALHLAHFKHEQKDYYVSRALYHQEIGLRAATAIMPHITEKNCSAIYVFSMLTFYTSLARPRLPGDFFIMADSGVADWLFLIKGTGYIMASSMPSLLAGPFGPIFDAGRRRMEDRTAAAEPMTGFDPIEELEIFIRSSTNDPGLLKIYSAATEGLRKSFTLAYSTPSFETGDIFSWVIQVSEGYIDLLRQPTPTSLVILAYFCVLLKRLDHYWWVEGWSTHLIAKIFHILDTEHRLWIRWPIEEIGWIPN